MIIWLCKQSTAAEKQDKCITMLGGTARLAEIKKIYWGG